MTDATPRHLLPLLIPGQAQKEFFHNEALTLIDLALHAAVEAAGTAEPPAAPGNGQALIVGATPGGAWAGHADRIAMWTQSGWRFAAPVEGMSVWNKAPGYPMRWDGAA